MKAILLPVLLLCSCVGRVRQLADGSVDVLLPVMGRADRFAVNATDGKGKTLKVMVANGSAEAVPLAAINAITTTAGASITGNVTKAITTSNNGVTNLKTRASVAIPANARKPIVTTPTVDPTTGQVLTPTVTQPAPAIIPK